MHFSEFCRNFFGKRVFVYIDFGSRLHSVRNTELSRNSVRNGFFVDTRAYRNGYGGLCGGFVTDCVFGAYYVGDLFCYFIAVDRHFYVGSRSFGNDNLFGDLGCDIVWRHRFARRDKRRNFFGKFVVIYLSRI